MPELPEVETVRRSLQQRLLGRRLVGIKALAWPKVLANLAADEFAAQIEQREVIGVDRRAKYLLVRLYGDITLVIHLRMTGEVQVTTPETPIDKHTHIVITLDNATELRFRDPRKFGRWQLLDTTGLAALDQRLGAEPLENWSLEAFKASLKGRRTRIKPLLLDQAFVAGIGNIYADEALWRAKIHPLRTADTLTVAEIAALHSGIIAALSQAVERRGTTLQNYRDASGSQGENQHHLNVYGRTGKPCPTCGSSIERIVVGQRSTHFCPHCQH